MSATVASDWLTGIDLHAIVEQVWSSYLDLDGTSPLEPVEHDASAPVTASVSVTNAWDGHIVISFTPEAAQSVAAVMLDLAQDDVTPGDVVDAVGELANVVGGNVKSLLPHPSSLSLPQVSLEKGPRFPGTRLVCDVTGQWRGEAVRISVLHLNIS